jgi:serine-type D-Ala-D-Ala carboxypeptidase (penicillin-binding protein 5/6)
MTKRIAVISSATRRRGRRIAAIAAAVLLVAATAAAGIVIWRNHRGGHAHAITTSPPITGPTGNALDAGTDAAAKAALALPPIDHRYLLRPAAQPLPVHYAFKHPPIAGILFDVKTGRVLWERNPRQEHPIASLTKMMTALLVAQHDPPRARVRISARAAHTPGSATGLLPRGHKVPLEPLLQALIMISANDAAVALAQHDAGTVRRFVREMNLQAQALGLTCTHYTTPNGLRDRGNHSCAADLAALARADLANPRIAAIAQTRSAQPRFPIKGKHLYLYNNHYFLQRGLSGLPQAQVTGLKTGFTDRAGRCYVTTARIAGHELGVVVLRSPNPLQQVPALLHAGFEELGLVPPSSPVKSPPAAVH